MLKNSVILLCLFLVQFGLGHSLHCPSGNLQALVVWRGFVVMVGSRGIQHTSAGCIEELKRPPGKPAALSGGAAGVLGKV